MAPPPFLLVHGENDFPRIIASNRRMLAALKRHHLPVRFQIEPGASHFDVALRLADPECATTATLRAWLRDGPSGFEPFREDHSVADAVHPEER
ncbi:prolyl oligopeptidase family serine peptidase [Alcanivorax sp. IO_7]|nr:prolyl oligopeptidase family serine peptidase [Alcanivorax sp. IO_7]